MTTAQAVGAVSREAAEWYALDWQAINRNVRRLQVRIVQATKESRWGKVRALQRLLTHSYSSKVLAVRRVTENDGKTTPGVDQEIWDTPEKKTQAVHRSEEHTSELQSQFHLVCRLLLEKKKHTKSVQEIRVHLYVITGNAAV